MTSDNKASLGAVKALLAAAALLAVALGLLLPTPHGDRAGGGAKPQIAMLEPGRG